jgi:hypothetical protein
MEKNLTKKKAIRTGDILRRHKRSRKEESEFGSGKREYILCPDCRSAYFEKSWHQNLEGDISHFNKKRRIIFKLCPACEMAHNKIFEGELIIKFNDHNSVKKNKQEILNLIKNSNQQAQERDPMDRVLWQEDRGDELHIFTSENQLAVKIGKKIKSSFPVSKIDIKHSGEDIIRVYVDV